MPPKAQDAVDSGAMALDSKKNGNADLIPDAGKVHIGKSVICIEDSGSGLNLARCVSLTYVLSLFSATHRTRPAVGPWLDC